MKKLQKWTDQGTGWVSRCGCGYTVGQYKGVPLGGVTCLYPDCDDGSTDLHMKLNCRELCTQTHTNEYI